jgi:hypothetical protein
MGCGLLQWSEFKMFSYTCEAVQSRKEPVAHTCNPSYLEGRDQEDRGSRRPTRTNSFWYLNSIEKTGCGGTYLSSHWRWGAYNRGSWPRLISGQKAKPYLHNRQSKKGWMHGSSGRAPASKARSPEFTPLYHKKKRKRSLQLGLKLSKWCCSV